MNELQTRKEQFCLERQFYVDVYSNLFISKYRYDDEVVPMIDHLLQESIEKFQTAMQDNEN